MSTIRFKVNSFRKIPNPFQQDKSSAFSNIENYIAVLDVKHLPTNIPKETNPREQKLTTGVARSIEASLLRPSEENFLLLNRGLLVSSESVSFDSRTSMLTLNFTDNTVHGNIDGGHTYEIIKKHQNSLEFMDQFVKMEIVTGMDEYFQDLARARNTSTQVKDKSIAELENKFEIIKKSLPRDIVDSISFKENEHGRIDVVDLLATLNLFDLSKYPNNQFQNFPVVSYSGKAQCIRYYLNYYNEYEEKIENPYVKMSKIMEDILRLYDHIETNIDRYYRDSPGMKYGAIKGVTLRKSKSTFTQQEINYLTPKSFIFPVLSSLRSLIILDNEGYYKWSIDPFRFMDEHGSEFVEILINSHRELGHNPNSTGKSKNLWNTIFMTATMKKQNEDS